MHIFKLLPLRPVVFSLFTKPFEELFGELGRHPPFCRLCQKPCEGEAMKTPAAGAVGVETHLSSLPAPAASWRRRWRRRGWRRGRWHAPVVRGRRRRGRHPPSVAVVMVPLDVATWDVASRLRHCDACECDCGEGRDEFHLVHCRVPFILCASPFSRLHRVRTIRWNFLTKFSAERKQRPDMLMP